MTNNLPTIPIPDETRNADDVMSVEEAYRLGWMDGKQHALRQAGDVLAEFDRNRRVNGTELGGAA